LNEIDVSYPDFQPLTEANARCFKPSVNPAEVGCTSIGFSFSGPDGPTLRQMFENSKRLFRNATPKEGPYGYNIFEIGPENARLEIYTKDSPESGFIMLQRNVGSDPKAAVWSDVFPLDDGNFAHFFFRPEQLKDIVDIQSKMTRLIASFPARGISK
jgi:hypothetical protein